MERLGGAAAALAVALCLAAAAGEALRDNQGRAFVLTLEFPYIYGRVVDNEGAGIENASVVCLLENGTSFSARTDENGYFAVFHGIRGRFRYALFVNENHTGFNAAHPNRGFASKVIYAEFDPENAPPHLLVLEYDPFDLLLSPGSILLEPGWTPVVKERRYEYRLITTVYGSKYNVRLVGGHRIYTNQTTTDPNYYRREYVQGNWSWSGDYDYATGSWVSPSEYLNKTFTAENGSEIGLHPALRNVKYRVDGVQYSGHYRVYRAGYWTFGGFRIYYVPDPYYIHFGNFYVGGATEYVHALSVPPQTFVITESEYRELSSLPLYFNNGSFVRVDKVDYALLGDSADIRVTVIPKNGYSGPVLLGPCAESGLVASPGAGRMELGSGPAETSVKVGTAENVGRGERRVFVLASDGHGRVVENRAVPVVIDLPDRPSPMTLEYLLSSPNSRIEVGVFSELTGQPVSGARVVIRFLANGAVFASGYTDNRGKFVVKPEEWPLNVNLEAEVSHPQYVTKYATIYTDRGGLKSVSVWLNCGDFTFTGGEPGYAIFYSNGRVNFVKVAKVYLGPAFPVYEWTGGNISLETTHDTYYFYRSYPEPWTANPSTPVEIKVYGFPKIEFTNAYMITITGRAGPPTGYVRRTYVGYSSKFAQ